MNQDFDWSLVRSFLAALDRGSLLGAARALNASQPTIGRHIAELESQLGVVLFERTGRGLLPSEAALRLAESARAMEGAALKLARSATVDQSGISGSVRISASQPVACVLLPPLLAQMRGVLPDVQVDLVVSNAVSNLLRREADIAVRMVQPDQATLVARRVVPTERSCSTGIVSISGAGRARPSVRPACCWAGRLSCAPRCASSRAPDCANTSPPSTDTVQPSLKKYRRPTPCCIA